MGRIQEKLTLSTGIGNGLVLPVRISAARPDAIRFMSEHWTAEDRTAHLGIFKASEGKEERLTLLVDEQELPREFQILGAQADDPDLKVRAIQDASFEAARKKRFDVVLTVPPGSPRRTRRSDHPVRVKLLTNNAERREIEFAVAFVSY
jgi:hypothetical protein